MIRGVIHVYGLIFVQIRNEILLKETKSLHQWAKRVDKVSSAEIIECPLLG